MSPQCLARLSEFRRGMALVIVSSDGRTALRYGRLYRKNVLAEFIEIQMFERPLERRPFVQAEFDEFCADPTRIALVDRILGLRLVFHDELPPLTEDF